MSQAITNCVCLRESEHLNFNFLSRKSCSVTANRGGLQLSRISSLSRSYVTRPFFEAAQALAYAILGGLFLRQRGANFIATKMTQLASKMSRAAQRKLSHAKFRHSFYSSGTTRLLNPTQEKIRCRFQIQTSPSKRCHGHSLSINPIAPSCTPPLNASSRKRTPNLDDPQ